MDLEDDTHMTQPNNPETVAIMPVPVILTEELINQLAQTILNKMDFESLIENYLNRHFDINDYMRDMDLDRLTENLTDEVIQHIKDRL